MPLNTVEEALKAIAAGEVIIVVDNENRENEGDFIVAAEKVTPNIVNFMVTEGKGLLCVALTADRCNQLDLPLMVSSNTSLHETNFTVSVDLLAADTTTGISVSDRTKTIQALANAKAVPSDFGRPGHIFPLKAKNGGVLTRAGHTEAAVDLPRLAGLFPAGALVEILNPDGTMARLPQLLEIAEKYNLKIVSVEALIEYRKQQSARVVREVETTLPTSFGNFTIYGYTDHADKSEHVALVKNLTAIDPQNALVRVHSSCLTGDIFGSLRCDCGPQLHASLKMIEEEGSGILIYLYQEGRGIGLVNKLKTYALQQQGLDTVEANLALGFPSDDREYSLAVAILADLHIKGVRLITNNPLKRDSLLYHGINVNAVIPMQVEPNPHNRRYLNTKKEKMGHWLNISEIIEKHNL